MHGPRPLHPVPCSFCGTPVPCRCLTDRLWDCVLWCRACEERYVIPSREGRGADRNPFLPDAPDRDEGTAR